MHPKAKSSPCRQQIPRRTLADGITVEAVGCVCLGDKLLELGHVLGAATLSESELAPHLVRVFFSGFLFFCLWGMNLVLFFVLVRVFALSPISDEVTQLCSTGARASDHGEDYVLVPLDLEQVCRDC